MGEVIDLFPQTAARTTPSKHVQRGQMGGPDLFEFVVDFSYAGKTWSVSIWATDPEDAVARVAALRMTACVVGQVVHREDA